MATFNEFRLPPGPKFDPTGKFSPEQFMKDRNEIIRWTRDVQKTFEAMQIAIRELQNEQSD